MLAGHGITADPRDLSLTAPPTALPGRVVVHAGAAQAHRRWPLERFAAVARELAEAGEEVVLTGSAAEAELAERVRVAAGLPGTAVLAGQTRVMELAGVVAAARLVVCGDTGVAHVATAFGTPSVVLFGPVSPVEWGPPRDRLHHVALWPVRAGAGPCGDPEYRDPEYGGQRDADGPDPVLLAIAVADVMTAAERLLRAPYVRAQDAKPSMAPGLSCTSPPS
jgi:ADP-heptose:LPS heptosyltransferase